MTAAQKAFWDSFVQREKLQGNDLLKVDASMPGDKTIADELVALYLSGRKTAGSGLVRSYEVPGEPLPKPGNYWIILDSREVPRCIAKTLRVEINAFDKVGEDVAHAEGDGTLGNWRKVHHAFFSPYLAVLGIRDLNQALVVTEFFQVWRDF
jgi:uncharacterized protein YhfF